MLSAIPAAIALAFRPPHPLQRACIWTGCLWLVCGALGGAARADNVILNDHRSDEIRDLTQRAERSVAAGDWGAAVAVYQQLVEAPAEEVYTAKALTDGPKLHIGVRRYALRQLSRMPAAGRAAYEARFGPLARRMARLAASERDKRNVVQRFLFTRAGDEVAIELAALSLERGEPDRAAYWLQQLQAKYELRRFQPAWLAMLAYCHRASGDVLALRELVEACGDRQDMVEVAGARRPLGPYVRGLAEELAEERGQQRDLDAWPLPGGDPAQARIAPFEVGSSRPGWRAAVTVPQPNAVTRFRYARRRPLDYRGVDHTPSRVVPAVGEGKVFLSNGHIVYAYNLYNGELIWQGNPLVRILKTPQDRMQSYTVTYHRGAVYAHIEPDNSDPVEQWSSYQIRTPMPRRALVKFDAAFGKVLWNSRRPELGPDALVNKVNICSAPLIRGDVAYTTGVFFKGLVHIYLMAFDTRTGDLLWSRHLGGGQQALNLFGRPYRETIGTMPALAGNRLFVCSNLGFVSCIDAENGEVLWVRRYERVRFLTTNNFVLPPVAVTWFSRPPLVKDGAVVVTPVDSRDLLCLDADTGEVRWTREARWSVSSRAREHVLVGAVDGKVFTAGRLLKAYDLKTGANRGQATLPGQVLGLGALTDKTGYLATSAGLVRFDTSTGRLRGGPRMLKSRAMLGNVILAGNVMLAVGEGSASRYHSEVEMLAYYDWSEMNRNLRALISREPDEPFAYNVLAAITYQRDDLDKALSLYEQALARARKDSRAEYRRAARRALSGIYTTYRERARRSSKRGQHEQALADLAQAEKLAVGPTQQIRVLELQLDIVEARLTADRGKLERFRELVERLTARFGSHIVRVGSSGRSSAGLMALLRLARAYEQLGKHREAVDVYQRILVEYPQDRHPMTRELRALYPGEDAPRRVEGADIARRAIDVAMHEHGSRVYAHQEQEARRRMALGRKSGALRELDALLRHYPNSSVVPEATLLLARRLIAVDRPQTEHAAVARRRLLAFLESCEGRHQAEARYLLFLAYDKDRMYPHAKGVLIDLRERHAGEVIEGPPRVEIDPLVAEQLARKEYQTSAAAPPLPRLELSTSDPAWTVDAQDTSPQMRVVAPQGAAPKSLRDRFFVVDFGKLSCRSAANGDRELWQRILGRQVLGLGWVDEVLVAWLRDGVVVGLDATSGRERWRVDLKWRIDLGRVGRGVVAVVGAIDRSSAHGRVGLLDGRTGELAWQKTLPEIPYPNQPLIGARRLAVWNAGRNSRLLLLELTTGRKSEPISLDPSVLADLKPVLIGGADRLVVPLNRRSGALALLDLAAGTQVRKVQLEGERPAGLVASETGFTVDYRDGRIESFDASGEMRWRASVDRPIQQRVVAGDHLYVLTAGSVLRGGRGEPQPLLVCYELATGKLNWQGAARGDGGKGLQIYRLLLSQRYIVAMGFEGGLVGKLQFAQYARDGGKLERRIVVSERRSRAVPQAAITGGRLVVAIGADRLEGYGK